MRLLKDIVPSTLVYMLAHTRRDAYYIDMARDLEAIKQRLTTLHRRRIALGESAKTLHDPLMMVWHEACGTEAQARARVAEIRGWPHAWRRRLIESQNPFWLDQGFLLLPIASTLFQPWCFAVPETIPKTRLGWSGDFLPAGAFPQWCQQGVQWQEAIRARVPDRPVTRRHAIPVYAVKHVSRETVNQGLLAHGMAVLDASETAAKQLTQAINGKLAQTGKPWNRFISLTSCYVSDYGSVNYCVCREDDDLSEWKLENALATAAAHSWIAAGKPATHWADLEADAVAHTAHAFGEDVAPKQAERTAAFESFSPYADMVVEPGGEHWTR